MMNPQTAFTPEFDNTSRPIPIRLPLPLPSDELPDPEHEDERDLEWSVWILPFGRMMVFWSVAPSRESS